MRFYIHTYNKVWVAPDARFSHRGICIVPLLLYVFSPSFVS
nr:MAG TPA: hypothetical protein [Myoviridae sp. ctNPX13]